MHHNIVSTDAATYTHLHTSSCRQLPHQSRTGWHSVSRRLLLVTVSHQFTSHCGWRLRTFSPCGTAAWIGPRSAPTADHVSALRTDVGADICPSPRHRPSAAFANLRQDQTISGAGHGSCDFFGRTAPPESRLTSISLAFLAVDM